MVDSVFNINYNSVRQQNAYIVLSVSLILLDQRLDLQNIRRVATGKVYVNKYEVY